MTDRPPLLAGVRVIESSLLGPGLIATFLSDLGAEVIKVDDFPFDLGLQRSEPKPAPQRAAA